MGWVLGAMTTTREAPWGKAARCHKPGINGRETIAECGTSLPSVPGDLLPNRLLLLAVGLRMLESAGGKWFWQLTSLGRLENSATHPLRRLSQ